jgi:uncharacterized protein YfaS (alpha-2-macroglobulin family)
MLPSPKSILCSLGVVLAAGTSLFCAGAPQGTATPSGESDLLARAAPESPGTLTFPPAAEPRIPRAPMPADLAGPNGGAVAVVEPSLDADGKFSIVGRTVRISFNQPMSQEAPAGLLSIQPPVAGQARWASESVLELVADKDLDPQVTYQVEVKGASSGSSKILEKAWTARFTAVPSVTVAGKVLGYVPVAGRHRVVAVHPSDGARVGAGQTIAVLYDQPVDLSLARSLVTLRRERGAEVPVVVDHPRGPTFQGVRVDPRLVVLLRPARALEAGERLELVARGGSTTDRSLDRAQSFSVAEPLAEVGVGCGYDDWDTSERCAFHDRVLWMSGQRLYVKLNNPVDLSAKDLARRVVVTPPVPNLTVHDAGWEETRLLLSGGFVSSTTYHVTIAGLTDRYGGRLSRPLSFVVKTRPLGASVSMPEGLVALDREATRSFAITSRNVLEAELAAWPVAPGDPAAFDAALARARSHDVPEGAPPLRIRVPIRAPRDRMIETPVDLSTTLAPAQSYLVALRPKVIGYGAEAVAYPSGSEAEKPPVALLTAWGPKALSVHARTLPGATVVHVSRLGSGEPVAGAEVRLVSGEVAGKTDALGLAWLGAIEGDKLRATADGAEAWLSLSTASVGARQLFPDLASGDGDDDRPGAGHAMIFSDRGIYRPGSTLFAKASARREEGDRLVPTPGQRLRVRLVGPTGEDVYDATNEVNDMGSLAAEIALPRDAKLGRHELRLEDPAVQGEALARTIVQVAEFEAPRFAVDVDAEPDAGAKVRATVRARYLFGAPMDGGSVSWTLTRREAPFADGPLTAAGLKFRRGRDWYEDGGVEVWSRAGDGTLGKDGTFAIEQAVPIAPEAGPQAIQVEADVTDSSYRHIAGRTSVVRHPRARYAGLKLGTTWAAVGGKMPVELGVIDVDGKPISGVPVTARLVRVEYRYAERRTASGALRWEWSAMRSDAGQCSAVSDVSPRACDLEVPRAGDYEVVAEAFGERGGVASFWAWRDGDDRPAVRPGRGRTIAIVADKASYTAGEKAKILVPSPYPAATAILTVERAGIVSREARRVRGAAALFEVPVAAGYAPYANVTVTLLPIGAEGRDALDYRIGALRLPVSLASSRVHVVARSERPSYEPGEKATVTVTVDEGGRPVEGAEVALAIVDEGVLRMTGYRAPDPVAAMRRGHGLSFELADSRASLAEQLERSHVAGDGGGPEAASLTSTRKNFVETALFRPDLRTDASGRATVSLALPDNLTEFRVMAVALDRDGRGGATESSFTVQKPVMLVPVVPRFASRGDRFEVAAMLHNNTAATLDATVALGDRRTQVRVAAGAHERVGFPFVASSLEPVALTFAVADGTGRVRDRVEAKLPVTEPGIEQHPTLTGTFAREQAIALAIPANAVLRGDESLRIQVGQRLWPELGARLDYLLGYPHGCVEQTTSSTLPLIAARAILPRIGLSTLSEGELAKRIRAGLERLATMRTASGGLGYWPGDDEPNVYGTAYAIRAVVLAKEAGVEPPRGLLAGMTRYLEGELLSSSTKPEVAAAIAQSLGELGELPASAADALLDRRKDQSLFGLASLAIALSSLGGQDDRVAALLDEVEAGLDERGGLRAPPRHDDFYYYGSAMRSRAQAAIALSRLRRGSKVLPPLLTAIASSLDSYTTQATAYSLLALGEHLSATPAEGAEVAVLLDGAPLEPARDLGFGSKEYKISMVGLRGKSAKLTLTSDGDAAIGFLVRGEWRAPLAGEGTLSAARTANGPDVYRVYTDPKGGAIDLAKLRAGDMVRVSLLARMPTSSVDGERLGYLAFTDRLPAGFEPIQPDLATVASAPDLRDEHPFASLLRWDSTAASHVELRDDRVNLYFDRVEGEYAAGTYLVRASTPGEFALPAASAELMYEGGSVGLSEAGKVVIQ